MDTGDILLALSAASPGIAAGNLIVNGYDTPISTIRNNSSLRLADFLKVAENRRHSLMGDETYNEAYARLKDDLDSLPDNYISIGKSDYAEAIDALTNIALGNKYSGLDNLLVSSASDALYDYYNSLNPFTNKRDIFGTQGVFNTGDPLQDYRDYLIAMKYFAAKNQNPFSLDNEDAVFNSFQDLKNDYGSWQEALKLANGENSTANDLKGRASDTVSKSQSKAAPIMSDEEAIAAFKYLEGETDEWPSSN